MSTMIIASSPHVGFIRAALLAATVLVSLGGTAHAAAPANGPMDPARTCTNWASICQDGTAAASGFTGQGEGGTGWIGNADGEGGPSNISRPEQDRHVAQAEGTSSDHAGYDRRLAQAEGISSDHEAYGRRLAQAEGTSSGHTAYGSRLAAAEQSGVDNGGVFPA